MNDTLVQMRLWVLIVLFVSAALIWFLPTTGQSFLLEPNGLLEVHFLDVGQGDAIFIESPTGVQLLVDGGPDAGVLTEIGKQMSFFDRSIDMVMATHPDTDHIGGLSDVLARYTISAVLRTENESDTSAATAFTKAVAAEAASVIYARRGQRFDLGGGATLEVLFPETNPKDFESNTASIVVQLRYGETEVMLTGDSPKSIEEYLVSTQGEHLQSDILKAGHHGSRTSTSELFLATVDPQFAVISTKKNSRYGHPHVEVTDALFNAGVETHSTAEEGTITFKSDGRTLWID